jgi:hypothetical protein
MHPPIAHYKLKKVCKTEMLRKLKQRFGGFALQRSLLSAKAATGKCLARNEDGT